jgi:hypothetical protein
MPLTLRGRKLDRKRPVDHVLDELSTLEGLPDPLEVSYVRTRCCSDRSSSTPAFS